MLPFGLAHTWSTLCTAVQKLSSFRPSMKVAQTNDEEIGDDLSVLSETVCEIPLTGMSPNGSWSGWRPQSINGRLAVSTPSRWSDKRREKTA
jgi:hypothetical protein